MKSLPQCLLTTNASNAPPNRCTPPALVLPFRCTSTFPPGPESPLLGPNLAHTSQPEPQTMCPPTHTSHHPRLPTNQGPLQSAMDAVP